MKLTIITVNYNNCDGLQKTIDSVVNQTCLDFEWIVIDGGSTDGSRELIEQYQEHFAYWCSEPDKGIYNAMNKGTAHAQGEYLLFLNSGDYLANEQVIEKCLPSLKDYDFISGDTITIRQNGEKGEWKAFRNFTAYAIVKYSMSHQSTFIRTELLKKRPYREDLKIISDWEQQLYELVFHDATYTYLPFVVSVFCEGGLSWTETEKHHHERANVTKEYFSDRLLSSVIGDNELKEIVNHIDYNTPLYKWCLWGVKVIRKLSNLFSGKQ